VRAVSGRVSTARRNLALSSTLAELYASVGAPPPDGSQPERGLAFDALLEGRRIREDLGFKPKYPRLADAVAAGA
jgi:UDP-glucose 4-epimerase